MARLSSGPKGLEGNQRLSGHKHMNKFTALDWAAFILVVVGGLNWLLVGLFSWDLVAAIFGDMTAASRVVYTLVGLGAIWLLAISGKLVKK